ncbi:MAG TPA: hypothetical protein VNK52_03835 [Hyphomicrobiaceae bacterium]|nr:hypothetical protein [Hyphomicrobiaceae bacterium]
MGEAWFKPKSYGYGATPKNWKGWVASTVFALVLSGLAVGFVALTRSGAHPVFLGAWLAASLLTGAACVRLARAKTDGEWRWRWRRQLFGISRTAGEKAEQQP